MYRARLANRSAVASSTGPRRRSRGSALNAERSSSPPRNSAADELTFPGPPFVAEPGHVSVENQVAQGREVGDGHLAALEPSDEQLAQVVPHGLHSEEAPVDRDETTRLPGIGEEVLRACIAVSERPRQALEHCHESGASSPS